MHSSPRIRGLLIVAAMAGCYNKPATDSSTSEAVDGSDSEATATATSATSGATTMSADSTVAATSIDPETSGSSGGAESTGTTGGGAAPSICDHAVTDLVMCAQAQDGEPSFGAVACESAVTDFSVFYEDVFTLEIASGDCLYVRVDNIDGAGATGAPGPDIALEIRSPSGAYAFNDDDVACTDMPWTGGACPQAQVTADVAGTFEIGIVQASGAGCVSPGPYSLFVAVNGVAMTPAAPATDDELIDCGA